MRESKPPPPRYRILERDGRLVTIDTWAKGAVAPESPLPGRSSDPSRPFRTARTVGLHPPALPERFVAVLLKVRDEQGRRLLTTSQPWDTKGPRVIALSAAGERQLGGALLGLAAAVAALLVLMVALPSMFLVLLFVGAMLLASVSKSAAPVLTRFLDTLGDSTQV